MKRGHIILISGGALLIIGIAITVAWGISFASTFIEENTIVAKTSISPGSSVDAQTVADTLGRPLSLAIGLDRQQSGNDEYRLKETVTDPSGKVVSSSEFQDSFFTTLQPEMTGPYTVTISNLGREPVTISGTFGYMPFVGTEGKPNVDAMIGGQGLGVVIVGGGLAAAGILVLIIGAIIAVVDGRKPQGSTSTTSEGGITYRKD